LAECSRQAGEQDKIEIEVTPEMIEAGAEIIECTFGGLMDSSDYGPGVAKKVFQAMLARAKAR